MKKISASQLPKKALAAISKRQRSYIDEFDFRVTASGEIRAYYAGDFLSVWNGKSWQEP